MNLILEGSKHVKWYSYLDQVFLNVPAFLKYYWLISNLECNYCPEDSLLNNDPVVIHGEELNKIIQANEIQFIWAVMSGFKSPLEKLPEILPYADGNPCFWMNSPRPQAPGAEVEIVCWDSTCTLFINLDSGVAAILQQLYPDILDLDEENKKRG